MQKINVKFVPAGDGGFSLTMTLGDGDGTSYVYDVYDAFDAYDAHDANDASGRVVADTDRSKVDSSDLRRNPHYIKYSFFESTLNHLFLPLEERDTASDNR